MHWYLSALKKYATFSGRARRREFWIFITINSLIVLVLNLADSSLPFYDSVNKLFMLTMLIPSTAVAVRRLHDIGRTGWWVLLLLVPPINIIILVFFMFLDGKLGVNVYGSNPKQTLP